MALLVPNVGEARLLTYTLKTNKPTYYYLRLFKNDYTPVEGSVIGDFTVANGTGYGEATITNATDWTIETGGGGAGVTTGTCAEKTFTWTADGCALYGYYVVDKTGSEEVLWAERFSDAPHTIPTGGGTQKVTLKITAE
jgi:hypothetical protein